MTSNRRRRWSNALLVFGSAATFIGVVGAASPVALAILLFVPLPFTGAAVLVRSRWRVGAALFVWGWWFFAAYHVLT